MKCPYCKEDIQQDAIKCKHCGSSLTNSNNTTEKLELKDFLFSFQGRITRSSYWLKYFLPYFGISMLTVILDVILGTYNEASGIGALSGIFLLIAIWPSIAVGVKRCHDRNRSGWFLLLSLIPFVNIWVIIELGFLKGTNGSNQYGPDPLI